ncbi:MAG: MFS transporter, partial [Novosphingobium sp.]|nr:MFS transporter [Novosphingobium sp.]
VDVMAYLTTRYFGLRHYGKIYGVYAGIYGLGVGAGATIAGGVFDRAGSYDPILIALGCGCALASFLVATLGRPKAWGDHRAAASSTGG